MIKDLNNFSDGCTGERSVDLRLLRVHAGSGISLHQPSLLPAADLARLLCADPLSGDEVVDTGEMFCKSQESKLALLWTIGIFCLNCGPVIMGFVLDYLGPKFTGILGKHRRRYLALLLASACNKTMTLPQAGR